MIINEKKYDKKSPEAHALEATVARYHLFRTKDLEDILIHEAVQTKIDKELERVAQELEYKERAKEATKTYVI